VSSVSIASHSAAGYLTVVGNDTITTAMVQDGAITPVKLDREYATKGTSIALSIALG